MINREKLLAAFIQDPGGCVNHLIANRLLKGEIRDCLSQCVLNNAHELALAPFVWLPLMPKVLSLVCVAGRCNLACRMCGGSHGELEYLHVAQFKKIIESAPFGELVIFVAGDSEPLLNPDMGQLLGIVREFGLNANIVTNGHLLTDKLIETMVKIGQPASLNISLDAATPETYRKIRGASLDHVLGRLRSLRDARKAANVQMPGLSLLMVGMEDNILELPRFVDLAVELGAGRVHVDHLNGSHSPEDFVKNPDWKKAVMDALFLGRQNGVEVQLPGDTAQIIIGELEGMMAADALPVNEHIEGLQKCSPCTARLPQVAVNGFAEFGPSAIGVTTEQPSVSSCPWLHSVHIELDGRMRICCNMPTVVGNIYDCPLNENLAYLRVRMGNLAGKIHKVCMGAMNCEYVSELKKFRRTPEFINPPLCCS